MPPAMLETVESFVMTRDLFERNRDVFNVPNWGELTKIMFGNTRNYAQNDRPRKRQRTSEPEAPPKSTEIPECGPDEAHVRLRVEGDLVSGVIGDRSANLKELESETSVNVHVENPQTWDRDAGAKWTGPTTFTLTGREENLVTACQRLAQTISEVANNGNIQKLILCVPDDHCGFVVGKKGANHKRILKEYPGLQMKMHRPDSFNMPNVGLVRPCILNGPSESVQGAIKEVVGDLCKAYERDRNKRPSRDTRGGGGYGRQPAMGGRYIQQGYVQPVQQLVPVAHAQQARFITTAPQYGTAQTSYQVVAQPQPGFSYAHAPGGQQQQQQQQYGGGGNQRGYGRGGGGGGGGYQQRGQPRGRY